MDLLELPPELLICIVEHLESTDDLLALARVSHLLHQVSIPIFFARCNFDPGSKVVPLKSYTTEQNRTVLQGLCVALDVVGQSFEELLYDCGQFPDPTPVILEELNLIGKFLSRISSVDRVTLRLSCPPSLKAEPLNVSTVGLLLAVLAARCQHLHVKTTQLSSVHFKENMLVAPAGGALLSKSTEWLKKAVRPTNKAPAPNISGSQHLRSCNIQTFPHFLRPFYLSSLQANAETLTNLSFKNLFGSEPDFSALLGSLNLPNLKDLSIKYAIVIRQSIYKFLFAHPGIESLEYHHIRYHPSSSSWTATIDSEKSENGSVALCQGLVRLAVSPEHILHFLPPLSLMPLLKDITIKVENLAQFTQFSALEEALWILSPCLGPIKLTLQVSSPGQGFGVWLQGAMGGGQFFPHPTKRPEARLGGVETLIVDNCDWDLTDDFLLRIPAWAGLFPSLKELTLEMTLRTPGGSRRMPAPGYSPLEGVFADRLKEKCRLLRKVSVLNSIDWSHEYEVR